MIIDLPALTRLAKPRTRRRIYIKEIRPTQAQKYALAKIHLKVNRLWADSVPRIMAAYRPSPIVIDGADESMSIIEAIKAASDWLTIQLTPEVKSLAVQFLGWHSRNFAQYALTASGVEASLALRGAESSDTIETFLQRNVALIKDLSADQQGKVSEAVLRGLQNRSPARDVAKELATIVEGGRARALRIAAHQMAALSAQLDTERMIDAGIDKWEWRHSGKKNYRPDHLARDGNIYTWKEPPSEMPGQLPWCGCVKRAVFDL